jgi:hypothetical protein
MLVHPDALVRRQARAQPVGLGEHVPDRVDKLLAGVVQIHCR